MNIPQVTRDRIASSLVGTPGVDTSGQQLGQEVAKSAEQVSKAAFGVLEKQQTYKDSAEANLLVAHNKMDVQTLLENYKDKYANNPEEASKHFWTDVKSLQDNSVARSSNFRVKQLVTQRDPLFDGRVASELGTWQYNQRDKLTTDSIFDGANELGKKAYGIASDNKSSYEDQSTKLINLFSVGGNLAHALDPAHPEKQAKMSKTITESLYKNTIDGYIDANPARALKFLEEPHVKEVVPGAMIEKMKNDAVTHLAGMQKRAEIEQYATTMVQHPALVKSIDDGETTFGTLQRMDPTGKLKWVNDLKQYAVKTQYESQIEDANAILRLHDKAYQLGLEARGNSGIERKDRRTPTESLQDLMEFQSEVLRMKPYMSKDAAKTFDREVMSPLTAAVAHLHTPGWGQKLSGVAGNFWNALPWGDKTKADSKVDAYAAGYSEIAAITKAQGKGFDAGYKIDAIRKYMERSDELMQQPNSRDANGLPYTPRSIAREVIGVGIGKPWPISINGKTYMIPVKSYVAPGQPIFDAKDVPPEMNFGEHK